MLKLRRGWHRNANGRCETAEEAGRDAKMRWSGSLILMEEQILRIPYMGALNQYLLNALSLMAVEA